MIFNLGTLGVFDTTRPKDFVNDFRTLLINYYTDKQLHAVPANKADIAILVSQLQKAFTDIRKQTTPEAIHFLDTAYDGHSLRTSHAIYNGMEIGITHKVDPTYPNIRDYDTRPEDLPEDIEWQSLASMQSAYVYYKRIADAYKASIEARIDTIVAHHPGQKRIDAIEESFVVTVPKDNTRLPNL